MSHGLTITANYTYSKNIDDAGTQRSGFALPATVTRSGRAWAQNRIDRSISANSIPQNLSVYGVYRLPFGTSGWAADHFITARWSRAGTCPASLPTVPAHRCW